MILTGFCARNDSILATYKRIKLKSDIVTEGWKFSQFSTLVAIRAELSQDISEVCASMPFILLIDDLSTVSYHRFCQGGYRRFLRRNIGGTWLRLLRRMDTLSEMAILSRMFNLPSEKLSLLQFFFLCVCVVLKMTFVLSVFVPHSLSFDASGRLYFLIVAPFRYLHLYFYLLSE